MSEFVLDTPVVRAFVAEVELLTNDTGCVWRHTYDATTGLQSPFCSGYVNIACEEPPRHETHP